MLTDSHCHLDRLDLVPYGGELSGAMAAARARGVNRFLCISINAGNAGEVCQIASGYPDVYATVGIHPLEFNEPGAMPVDEIASWLRREAAHPRVIGIGETGLDYYYSTDAIERQQAAFACHLGVAAELGRPVIVHSRDAREPTLDLIRRHGSPDSGGILHCFTESWEMAREALDLGYYISFSGIITFRNAAELREVVKKVPMDRLLVETDSPYLAPVPHRGKANEPAYIVEVARCVAELRGLSFEAVCEQTDRNFATLFGLAP